MTDEYQRYLGRESVIKIIQHRLKDLQSCSREDDCQLRAKSLEVVLDDIRTFYPVQLPPTANDNEEGSN